MSSSPGPRCESWAAGSAAAPEPPPGTTSDPLEAAEERREGVVRSDGQGAGESESDEGGVDEAIAQVHVGEQASVYVAALGVEGEAHPSALDQTMVEIAGTGSEALHRLTRGHRLRRVDADIPHVLLAPTDADLDRVAVDDPRHVGG